MTIIWLIVLVFLTELRTGWSNNVTEYVVRFNGYFDESQRLDILRSASIQPLEKRPSKFSDFEIVSVEDVKKLSSHPLIRDVLPNRSSIRFPLFKAATPSERRKIGFDIRRVPMEIQAQKLWEKGYTGRGIKVAIFDTGLSANRQYIRNVVVERDYTDEGTASDTVGHGTFTAGLIGSTNRRCPGVAPNAELFIYKVFSHGQKSQTSWFLDAFNDALQNNVHVINLSIGGPDFKDKLFMEKVNEAVERGIIIVSAIGNDGPTFGTLNNPADHPDVIGVGAIDRHGELAHFSSRGTTSWELTYGYGRVKPDILASGVQVQGLALNGGCRFLSGTSVAAPVVSGAVTLLLSSLAPENRTSQRVKQSLSLSAERLPNLSMFEQGAGRLSLLNSFVQTLEYKSQITFTPEYLDMDDCPFQWPYCFQPLYLSSLPLVVNITIQNGYNTWIKLSKLVFQSHETDAERLLSIQFENNNKFRYSGFLGLYITATDRATNFSGVVSGQLSMEFETQTGESVAANFPIHIRIIPKPFRSQRILWDQFRNLYYPFGYFPRDDLRVKNAPFDWTADHPHTNFRRVFELLRQNGYFLEISTQPLTCIDLNNYATLLIVDPEEEYFPEENDQLKDAVDRGLNLIVMADWFNESLINKIQFEDPNSDGYCHPETGGSNIPALNVLLKQYGFAFGDTVLEGDVKLLNTKAKISSGINLLASPSNALIVEAKLHDLGAEVLQKEDINLDLPIFGINWPTNSSGFVALFGDSTCLESGNCNQLLLDLLHANRDAIKEVDGLKKSTLKQLPIDKLPQRITNPHFASVSRVVRKVTGNHVVYRRLPTCKRHQIANYELIIDGGSISGRLQVIERIGELKRKSRLLFANQTTPLLIDYDDYVETGSQTTISIIIELIFNQLLYLVFIISFIVLIGTCIPRYGVRSRIYAPLARALRVVFY
ncbi:hypothetical protein M3Y94_00752400 [Aphelenchoides besseyi]|nr:hypothetical protein M3Y94_00752400 [Aphelenchoides besseyi]KAI6232086.1 hypothetical protein M3Y95_00449800 [Aphelenchoides besseyi]